VAVIGYLSGRAETGRRVAVSLSVSSCQLALGFRFPVGSRAWALAVCWRVLAADAGEFEEGVDGSYEGMGVALDLGEEEAALECGEQGDSKVVMGFLMSHRPG
jgi:hypothetical protein